MSEDSQNIGDEQAVVGEPASHPHQAVVVGEPPEDAVPVLGEPAFANGLQDQQPVLPSSADETSANGVQSSPGIPFHEEGFASLVPSAHASAPSSTAPVEENPDLHVPFAEATEAGIGEAASHQLEFPVTENPGLSDSYVNEPSSAFDVHVVDAETPVTVNTHGAAHNEVEESADDNPDVIEVTHLVDSPSPPPQSEVPTENPFAALDEGTTTEPGEVLSDDAPSTDPADNASATPDEISLKGPDDQQEESSSSTVQEKHSTVDPSLTQTVVDDAALDVGEAGPTAELTQFSNRDTLTQESDAKEANAAEEEISSSVPADLSLTSELNQVSEKDAFVQGNATTDAISEKPETSSTEVGHHLNREVPQSGFSSILSSSPKKDIPKENQSGSIPSELQSNEKVPGEAASSVAPQHTRDMAAEEFLVDQSPAEESSFAPTANGDNGYQHTEDGERALDGQQDLPKDHDDASAEDEKPSSGIKLPLIFTGLAIAVVGVAVASISRHH